MAAFASDGYAALAPVYDRLNDDIDYGAWADYIAGRFAKEFRGEDKPTLLLELGCGTGSMTRELCRRGFDMTALDISEDMLSVAEERLRDEGIENVLWLHESMADFELYGTVDGVVCCLDGINHLTGRDELADCFHLVAQYLNPGGLFLFDVNTPEKFRTKYADNDYLLERDGAVLCWSNRLNKKGDVCDFLLTVFEEQPSGLYKRTDGVTRERCYGLRALQNHAKAAGLTWVSCHGALDGSEPGEECERWYVTLRKE